MAYYEIWDVNGRREVVYKTTVGEEVAVLGSALNEEFDNRGLEPGSRRFGALLFLECMVATPWAFGLLGGLVLGVIGVFAAVAPFFLILRNQKVREVSLYALPALWGIIGIVSALNGAFAVLPFALALGAGSYFLHLRLNTALKTGQLKVEAKQKAETAAKLIGEDLPFESDFRPSMPCWFSPTTGALGRYDDQGFHLDMNHWAECPCPYTEKYDFAHPYQIKVSGYIEKQTHQSELFVRFNDVGPENYTVLFVNNQSQARLFHLENDHRVVEVQDISFPPGPGPVTIEIYQTAKALSVEVNGTVVVDKAKVNLPPGKLSITLGGIIHTKGKLPDAEKTTCCFKSFSLDKVRT